MNCVRPFDIAQIPCRLCGVYPWLLLVPPSVGHRILDLRNLEATVACDEPRTIIRT